MHKVDKERSRGVQKGFSQKAALDTIAHKELH